jgi:hypothetical protein
VDKKPLFSKCLVIGIILFLSGVTTVQSINFNDTKASTNNSNHNGWIVEIIDTAGDVGQFSSLALDSFDNPHIIYFNYAHPYLLKYAYKTGSNWVLEIVDNNNFTGFANTGRSIAIDSQDKIHIVYLCEHFNPWWCQVKYAVRTNNTWNAEILDNTTSEETPYLYPSLVLDNYDTPHIAYTYVKMGNHGGVKYLTYNGSAWVCETVALSTQSHDFTSTMIAIDTFCQPHITFRDSHGGIYYASKENENWIVNPIDYGPTFYPCIAVDSSGVPHISYDKDTPQGINLMYAIKKNGYWENNSIDTTARLQLNMVIDSNDYPHIAYSAKPYDGFLKYARWTGSEWEFMEVDLGVYESTGTYSSIAIDSNGLPHISYYDSDYDETNGDLRYASLLSFPPSKPEITGQNSGKIREEYEYSIVSQEPDGDSIYYFVDWGDNTTTGWIGPYSSGENVNVTHIWDTKGTFTVKVKARDSYNSTSWWEYLEVTMPKNTVIFDSHPFLNWFLERFPNTFPILRYLLGFNQ